MRILTLSLLCAVSLPAEVRSLTLRQALELAATQNPDVALARLDEQKASHAVRIARDPFVPKIVMGSGVAYTNGFPLSIEGSAPSVVRADATATVFNRPQSYRVAQARENVRGAAIGVAARREEVELQVALLFLDAQRLGRAAAMAARQIPALDLIVETIRARVSDGRELPIEVKKAELRRAQAMQRVQQLKAAQEDAEATLATVLGLSDGDRARPVEQEEVLSPAAGSLDQHLEQALNSDKEIRRLESAILAQGLEVKANKATRLPQIDLVAQYALFARYNNYEDFFRTFQRNNGQFGVSIQIPLLAGSAASANAARAEAEISRLRIQMTQARNRVAAGIRNAHQSFEAAETALGVARLSLEVAREQVTVLLAQLEEGRASMRQVEEARFEESEKWISLYDARYAAERAKLALLKLTGNLMSAIR